MKRFYTLFMLTLSSLSGFAQCPDGNHPHFIDLGLPSGKGWACCNVNATTPEDFGGFYAYGEDREKPSYTKNNYLYGQDIGYGYYIWDNIGQRTDISGSAGYDVAYKVMGEDWRMPTKSECEELVDSCTWEWSNINGVTGYKVVGPNNNYIFLPAAGFKSSFNHNKAGERGLYRSSMWTMINGEASSSYSIDFTKDGVQVNSLGYRVNGLTVRPISAASMNCFVNSSFLEDQKDREARGFTADGKSEIAITYKAKNTILDENADIKFYLDGQNVDETVAGKVKEIKYIRDSLVIILTAPKDFLVSQGSEYMVNVEVTPYCKGMPLSKVSYKFRVLRPCVLFLHGLNDNGNLFDDMRNFLVNKELYDTIQLFSVDYHQSSTSSFYTNTHENSIVKKGCETICKRLFETDSIVSSKFDMVGHSMGGILARLYAQEVEKGNESTDRIITLNTPHYGSRLGNTFHWLPTLTKNMTDIANNLSDITAQNKYVKAIADFTRLSNVLYGFEQYNSENDLNGEAVSDLAIGSDAIMNLNGPNSSKLIGIPIHSVCTYVDQPIQPAIKTLQNHHFMDGIRLLLTERLIKTVVAPIDNYHNEQSDLVVPLESQKGGLEGYNTSVFSGKVEEANHISSPHWKTVHMEIANLLLDHKDGKSFSLSGFPPYLPHSARRQATMSKDDFIATFDIPRDESFISATIIPVASEDYTHLCNVSHSDDMLTYEVFAMPTEETVVFGVDEKQIQFDLSNVEGDELKFYIVGRTNYNALLLDSVTVNLKADPSSIHSANNNNEKVYVSYSTNDVIVNLPSSINGSIWQLFSIDGSFVGNGKTEEARVVLNGRKRGVYILKVTKGNTIHTYKLLFE